MAHQKKGPVTQLKEQLGGKLDSCKRLQEDYLRALADFDNLRKRTERDSEVSQRLALEALALDLLPVLDNFERAMEAVGADANAEGLKKGMDLIHRQLRDTLCKHGVEEFSCVGTQFDPRRAEAIGYVTTGEHEPRTVVSEVCKGSACGERVIRPAKVLVAREPQRMQNSETRNQNSEGAGGEEGRSQKSEVRSQSAEGAGGEQGQKSEGRSQKAEGADAEGNEGAKAEAGESGGASNG